MSVLVDTSVWSHALRKDVPGGSDEAAALQLALAHGETVVTTGLVLQELLQGFAGPKARAQIITRFAALPLLSPGRQDHIDAAAVRNRCRRRGVQIGTVDALIAQLCIRHSLTLLTSDRDFARISRLFPLRLWIPGTSLH